MSHGELRGLAGSLPHGVVVVDSDAGSVREANARFARLFDRSVSDLHAEPLGSLVESVARDDDDVERFDGVWTAVSAGDRESGRCVVETGSDDGVDATVELHLAACESSEGDRRVVATARDVADDATARDVDGDAAARDTRPWNTPFAETLLDNFPNGIVTLFDDSFRYTHVGGSIFDELSLSSSDLEGERLHDVFPAENAARLEPLYRDALDGESNATEVSFDGRDFVVFVRPVRDDEGDVVAGMTVSQDVSERRARERDLESARKRYRSLLEAAPDPVFVADAETGELIETNEAGTELLGRSRDDILGRNQSALHPAGEADRYRRLFEAAVDGESAPSRFPDGSPVCVVTADGDRVPVSNSTKTVDLPGGTVIYGIFRDDSERLAYERTLTELNAISRRILGARTEADALRRAAETITDVLEFAVAVIYRFDEGEGRFQPVTVAPTGGDLAEELPSVEPGENELWRVFVDDGRGDDGAGDDRDDSESITSFPTELVLPLGDYGVLLVADADCGTVDERTRTLLDIVRETAEAALEHRTKARQLDALGGEVSQQHQYLERLTRLKRSFTRLLDEILQADSRADVEDALCSNFGDVPPFTFCWFGVPDSVTETLTPRAWAGEGVRYLDQISRSLDGGDERVDPAVTTAHTEEPTVVANTADAVRDDSWRRHAVSAGFRSAMSVPVRYNEVFYGVFTLYSARPDTFDDTVQLLLEELGAVVGIAINAIYRKHALSADVVSELEFEIEDPACFFVDIAQTLHCSLEFKGMVPEGDGTTSVLVDVADCSVEAVRSYADRSTAIRGIELLDDRDSEARFRFSVADSFIGTYLANYAISLCSIAAEATSCRVVVSCPPTVEPKTVRDVFATVFPQSELLAKRDRRDTTATTSQMHRSELDELTDRQREVLLTAYRNGYFDTPKKASGVELASKMNLSTSAFHDHLRTAEGKLFASIVEASDASEP